MKLRRLKLRCWRGIEECDVIFNEKGVTLVEGPNESGKTSLLEAFDTLLDELDTTTKSVVRSVKQVHRDEASEVEAEFTTGPYELVYRKQFFKKPATTLTVRAPRPENHSGRDAHERVRQILAETLDLDLWTALRVDQGAGLDPAALGKAAWLGAALERAAGGSGVGGEAELTLLAAVEEEASRWWTPTGRENREQSDLADTVATATSEVATLREAVARVETDVEAAARLARERVRRAAAHTELRQIAARLDQEVRALEALRTRRAEQETIRTHSEAALHASQQGLRDRWVLASQASKAAEDVAKRERALAETASEATAAASALAAAEESLVAARLAAANATVLSELRDRDFEHRRDEFDLRQLTERMGRIVRAEDEAQSAQDILRRNSVDDETLTAIRKARDQLTRAQALADAAGPAVQLDASTAVDLRIDDLPTAMGAGERRQLPVAHTTRVEVPGVLRIEVVAGTGVAESRKSLESRRKALQTRCEDAGVMDADEAERAHAERREASRLISERDEKVAENRVDLTREQMEGKIARLTARVSAWPADRPAEPSPAPNSDVAKAARDSAKARATKATRAATAAEEHRDEFRQARDVVAERMHELEGQLKILRGQSLEQDCTLADARRIAQDEELTRRRDVAMESLKLANASLAAVVADFAAAGAEELDARAANAHASAERAAGELQEVIQQQTAVVARLETTVESGVGERLAVMEAQLANATAKLASHRAHAAAAKLLLETLRMARDEARARYVAPYRDKLESFGRVVFGSSFRVDVGEDLALVSRTVVDDMGAARTVPFESLSGGTREQLGVISRLACAALVEEQGGVPVILDDVLGFSDPQRLEGMGALLSLAGRQSQVILLTCDPDRYRAVGGARVVRMR